ncbi:MAG: cobalt ECF transporter T component CbiQ [Candidatus Hydrogenedentes bacterium]|nr:cobalt ECF transporter T component CbiQ [Candidatus Hydrogenedentota bacterium]
MALVDLHVAELGALEEMARRDSSLRRIDPRAKLVTTLVFILTVVSFGIYELAALLPLLLYPVVLLSLGDLPTGYILRKVALVSPFAILVGIFNPLLDHSPHLIVGDFHVSGGWISFASILLRFVLTVSAALILIASTGVHHLALALQRLGAPSAFVMQLLFLYRYLFVLTQEALRTVRAITLRSVDRKAMSMKTYAHFLGSLLLRTLDRAQRIHVAMRCRGYDGSVRLLNTLQFRAADALFIALWCAYFLAIRFGNVPHRIGELVMGVFT